MFPTAEEISINYDLTGKVVLITGATSGIGKEAARVMAMRNCKVLLGGRTREKAAETKKELLTTLGESKADLIEPIECNLSSLGQIRDFCTAFKKRSDRQLNILMNNAGAIFDKRGATPDGFESNFGVNHLAPALLTFLLLPVLRETAKKTGVPSRIVHVASGSHVKIPAMPDYDDYNSGKLDFSVPVMIYSKSKLANIYFSHELNKHLSQTATVSPSMGNNGNGQGEGEGEVEVENGGEIISNCLAPGVVLTGVQGDQETFKATLSKLLPPSETIISIPEGAATQVFVAADPSVKTGGHYYYRREINPGTPLTNDDAGAKKIWELTQKLIDLTYEQALNEQV